MDLDRSVPVRPQVAAEYRVTQSTIQKAVVQLRKEGRLRTVLGAGSYVMG